MVELVNIPPSSIPAIQLHNNTRMMETESGINDVVGGFLNEIFPKKHLNGNMLTCTTNISQMNTSSLELYDHSKAVSGNSRNNGRRVNKLSAGAIFGECSFFFNKPYRFGSNLIFLLIIKSFFYYD